MIDFFVEGRPRPAGSKRALFKNGKAVVFDMSGQAGKVWRRAVAAAGKLALDGKPPLDGPVCLAVWFYMPRAQAHRDRAGNVRATAPSFHTIRPDATKLVRAVEDALTGVCWLDDAQIVDQEAHKDYGFLVGARIVVRGLGEGPCPR